MSCPTHGVERVERTVWLCVTRACNFACRYCYQGQHRQVPPGLVKDMDDAVMERALKWALDWVTDSGHLNLNFYGGEPLLQWPLIQQWIPRWKEQFSGRRSIRVGITTNGSFLTSSVREWLDKNDVGILLSMDGPPELHDQTRQTCGGGGTSRLLPAPEELLAWRPNLEIAWQLDPSVEFLPRHIDQMVALGFRHINWNVNFSKGVEWCGDAARRLETFFEHAGRLMMRAELASNWRQRIERLLNERERQAVPCGTGHSMVGVSPEGWIYPSQEMVYTVFLPDRAPGTAEFYRLGDVFRDPVIDEAVLRRVSEIRTAQLRPPAGFDCTTCWARVACLGGCHCQYAGQDGIDPANRYDVAIGFCQSLRAVFTGLVRGAIAAGKVGDLIKANDLGAQVGMINRKLDTLTRRIEAAPFVRMEVA